METYLNTNFAYSIQYPKNWIVKECPESDTVDFQIPDYPDVWITTWARVQVEDTSPPGEPFQLSNGEKAYYMTNTIKVDSLARFFIFHYKNGNMYYVGVEYPLPYNKEFFNEYMELFHEVMRSLDVKS